MRVAVSMRGSIMGVLTRPLLAPRVPTMRFSTLFSSSSIAPLVLLVGCQGPGAGAAEGPLPTDEAAVGATASGESADDDSDAASKLEDLEEALAKAERDRRYAMSELEIARLAAVAAEMDVEESLMSARAKVEEVQAAYERFETVERPLEIDESKMSGAQAEERLIAAETDLVGILEIFDDETEARSKDEIIRRKTRAVEMAKDRVAIAKAKHDALVQHTLPARMREKGEALRKAQAALAKAEASAKEKRRRTELSAEKASDAVEVATEKLEKARRKLEEARAAAQKDADA